jgi:hypothetical protein
MTKASLPSPAALRTATTAQAQGLKKSLGIQLTAAKDILARGVYECADWIDLQTRLGHAPLSVPALALALGPGARSLSYLEEHEQRIVRAIASLVLTNTNLLGMLRIVRSVFGFGDHPVEIEEIVPSLDASPWRSAGIGPDPYAVIEAFTRVNGVHIKLIGTRVYLPGYLALPDPLAASAGYAANWGDPLQIMWRDPQAWYQAAYDYLSLPEDEDLEDFRYPECEPDQAMQGHHAWFQAALRACFGRTGYLDGDDEAAPIPLVFSRGCYLVFGVPCAAPQRPPASTTLPLLEEEDNGRSLVTLDGQLLCVEALTVDPRSGAFAGEFKAYAESVGASLFGHPDHVPTWTRRQASVCFVAPASAMVIGQALRLDVEPQAGWERFAIKTDNMELMNAVLERVERREMFRFAGRSGTDRYVVTLEPPAGAPTRFSLAIDLCSTGQWRAGNFVVGHEFVAEGGRSMMHVELHGSLPGLMGAVSKKRLLDAARDGLVLCLPERIQTALDAVPRWCARLPTLAPAVQALFESPLLLDEGDGSRGTTLSIRMTRYSRDNY